MMQGFEKIAEMSKYSYAQMELAACQRCNEPCVNELCKACELLEFLRSKYGYSNKFH